jgi:hypothetical protein
MTPTKSRKAPKSTLPETVTAAPIAEAPRQHRGKLGILLGLLQRKEGATLFEMSEATGWQHHSVRGALAGSIKKKLGLEITSEKPGNERIYRIKSEDPSGGGAKPADPV